MLLPPDKQKTFDNILIDLQEIENIQAIVLGGSFATGRVSSNSDLDIGVYYHEKSPFSISEIREIAEKYAIDNSPSVTDFYQWGPWVNGGAWIQTESGKVDLLYRNINQLRHTIKDALEGIWQNHFEQQPPYGFSSIIYLAEIESCIPLYDPHNIILYLKSLTKIYPEKLKKNIIQESLWSAEFTLINAESYINQNDYYNSFGCFTRVLKALVQALFAINETYPIGDKKAIEILEASTISPKDFQVKVKTILSAHKSLIKNLELLKNLFQEIIDLAGSNYKAVYNFM